MTEPDTERAAVVIVDDDATILAVLADVVREEGYEPVPFRNAAQAEAFILEHPPRLVITDLRLPEGSGADLALRLRERGSPLLPIVVMTGQADAPSALRLPVQEYLMKPFDLDQLCAILRRWARPAAVAHGSSEADSAQTRCAW